MTTPQSPTAAQLTQLAVLAGIKTAAAASYTTNVTAMNTAQTVLIAAENTYDIYLKYIYGGRSYPNTIDNGNPNQT